MASGRSPSITRSNRPMLLGSLDTLELSRPELSSSRDQSDTGVSNLAKATATSVAVETHIRHESMRPEAPCSNFARVSEFSTRSSRGSFNEEDKAPDSPDLSRSLSPGRDVGRSQNQFRQDSASESIRCNEHIDIAVDPDRQATNARARAKVEILRGRVLRTRRTINEQREDLQTLRERFRDVTDKFMRGLNEFMVQESNGNQAALVQYYEQVRALQDKLGPAEDDYDILELRLSREEDELEKEETRFYTSNNIVLRLHPDEKLDEQLTPHIKPYEPEDTEYENLDLENELVKQYLAAVAEADYLGEQLDSLEDDQYRLSQELSFRMRHKIPITKRTTIFLFDFPQAHKGLLKQLHDAEDSLYQLRDRCIAERLFTEAEYAYVPHNALVDEINESVNEVRDRSQLRTAVRRHNVAAYLQDTDFEDKKNYVNSWMLDWIQDSSLDALRLQDIIYSQYPQDGKQLHDDDWSKLALDFWNTDDAGKPANQKHVPGTMDAILEGTGTSGYDLSLVVDLGEEVFEPFIIGREAASHTTQKNGLCDTARASLSRCWTCHPYGSFSTR